jgi:hypothetical protein
MENENASAALALSSIIRILNNLDEGERQRILKAVTTFFGVELETAYNRPRHDYQTNDEKTPRPSFSADTAPSPKQFMLEKQPKTDVERIACLAYYLTHYREMPNFKTLDLAKLNTEAAQPKFANTSYSTANAGGMGYLVPASGGMKQISAAGEQFVRALPDREAAKAAMSKARPRKLTRRKS